MDWREFLEKKDINDNYKKVMERATELSINSCEDNEHCGATSGAINEQLKDGKQKLSHIRGITNGKDHVYNKNRKGHIIDASRKQFGDKEGIHVIKPDDKRYKEYEDIMPHKKNPFLDRISLVDEKKSWEVWLEKDSLDGKGANDKIKPANWVANNSDEKTENWTYMKPEDFSDIAHSEAHDDAHKIPKRPSEYSPENKPRKWKTPKHGTIHTGQEKKPATAEGEKNSKGNDMNYNRRGDELGSIERYQNKLRHGEPIPAPSLGVSGGGKGKKRQAHGHEGRHRAEAATREGEKTIPVGIGHSALRTGGEKKLTSRQVASLRGENTMIGQSERSIRQNVKDGMESLKSGE